MFDLGTKDIVLVAVILVFLFGAKQIPALTKGIADAIRHVRGAFKEDTAPAELADAKKR